MSYFSPDSRSYFNSASHYNSSYYNEMYRSFNNLRQSQAQIYQQPLYVSTIPFSLMHKSSSYTDRPKYEPGNKRASSSTRVASSNCDETQDSGRATITPTRKNLNNSFEENKSGDAGRPVAKKRDGSYESVYNGSRSSTPPNPNHNNQNNNNLITNPSSSSSSSSSSNSTLSPSPNSTPSPSNSSSNSNSRTSYNNNTPATTGGSTTPHKVIDHDHADDVKYSESNDLTATATSNIMLNCTDDLTTQVDYYLNEVDYRMICRGKHIELESFELSSRGGLISKCLYLNDLLNEASMNESLFEADPIFMPNGKATLMFGSVKDSEEFALYHLQKFDVQFTHRQTPPPNNTQNNNNNNNNINNKKNVSFITENNNNLVNDSFTDYLDNDSRNNKSILKNTSLSSLGSPTKSTTSESSSNSNSNVENKSSNDASLLVSANAAKNKKTEGYEILTIKAKLKQRVGQNRTKAVELHDIDSIMRNVVTIIQDEFMKRFPSGPSIPVTTAIKSN